METSRSYKGVAKDIRYKTMLVAESAVAWLHRRCQNCCEITFYMVESETEKEKKDIVLRKMLVTDEKGMPRPFDEPPRLRRLDNLLRDYLFRCVDTSDSVSADAYEERHLAFPVRDKAGMAICVLDISIGKEKQLSPPENKEMTKMLRLLQMAYLEIDRQSEEGSGLDAQDVSIMFDKLMLQDLKENVRRLDAKAYGEMKSYQNPPASVILIIRAVLSIFYPEKALEGALEKWGPCKKLVGVHLGNMVMDYDPTSTESVVPPADILAILDDVTHNETSIGSKPAKHLYNWVLVCLSLLEHTRKMKAVRATDLAKSESGSPREGSVKADEEPTLQPGDPDAAQLAEGLKEALKTENTEAPTEETQGEHVAMEAAVETTPNAEETTAVE